MVGLGPAPGASDASRSHGLSAGTLLNAVLDLVRAHPVPLLLPLLVYGILASGDGAGPGARFEVRGGDVPWELLPFFAALGVVAVVVAVLLFLVFTLAWLVTTRAALAPLRGEGDPDLARAFDDVKRVYWPAALTTLLWGVLVAVGLVLLIVPGVIALVGWTPWAAIVVAERRTGWEALSRAWDLTRGHRLDLFWLLLLAFGVEVAANVVFGWWPVVGDVLVGAVNGVVLAAAAVLGAVFYVHRTGEVGGAPAPA